MADEPVQTSSAASRDKAFEIFVKRTINSIQKEAWGRSKEVKEIRESCQVFLNRLDETGCSEEALREVLYPLGLACSSSMQKIVDLALGCLHKLVAHAWLQGESTPAGSMDMLSATGSVDGDDTVAQVIKMVIKCGETNNEALQLAVVRALLTFATAEHFVAHGECLLAAVRTVFNLALGSDNAANKRTACNALLQMLNTIAKRVTQIQPRFTGSEGESSRAASDATEMLRSFGSTQSMSIMLSPKPSMGYSTGHGVQEDGRAAQFASLAEARDLRGLEAALEAGVPPLQEQDEEGESDTGTPISPAAQHREEGDTLQPVAASEGRSEQQGADGAAHSAAAATGRRSGDGHVLSTAAVQQAAARSAHRSGKLSTNEKDVLLVLTAFCKLASREAGASSTESYLNQGKLLALELLSKVLQNPVHAWDHVREPFCRHLRQPLCLALLRNCAASDPTAFQLAVALLGAILTLPRLRLGLRAELGAFYPLLVLRPLEQEAPDPANLATALGAIQGLVADPRLLVDVFVNYDCDLQAPNLYERTMQCLGKLAQQPDPEPDGKAADKAEAMQRASTTRQAAVRCLLDALAALDVWATPIKDANQRSVEAQEANSSASSSSNDRAGADRQGAGDSSGGAQGEMERFGAAKSAKESLSRGLALFNGKDPLKGLEQLVADGLLQRSPAAAAEFLRKQASSLDKAQIGELFGHHSEFAISVMHAWIDGERYEGLPIDGALRLLLEQFRLPGEAQKIDRIMEKFAERYCRDNPSKFRNADAAYMLAFAIIMLNTDAHNPMAERRLGKPDFVAMCYQQTDEGMAPVLPQDQVEAIYDRIVSSEIVMRDESAAAAARGQQQQQQQQRNRLASALGWARRGGWDKQRGADAERRAMMEMAERELAKGMLSGNVWHSAQHAEHVRPMLQASGRTMLDAMASAFASAPDAASAATLLQGLVRLARLAALLGLDDLCEAAVAVLAQGAGVFEPAPYGSPAEEKQLSALRSLLSLPTGPEAGLLGSSWALVLRVASALEALRGDLTKPQQPAAAARDAAASATAAAAAASAAGGNAFSRMFQNVFRTNAARSDAGDAGAAGAMIAPRISTSSGHDPMEGQHALPVREAPGASLVLWAQTDGRQALEMVYSRSAALDGDGIVVFMRALCAISQEELEGHPPRLHSLTKVVECAHVNAGRIRLVWGKLWSVVAAQLVGAACNPNKHVASYAVESLRQLVARLLSRSELANFTHQEEALRPFVAVLKQCDEVAVRELAVQCVMGAVAAHPKGLGSGWRQAIEALRVGAADPAPAVMAQAQESLQVVVEALYHEGPAGDGHECLRECVRAIVAGVSNQAHLELSISAVGLLARTGARLAAWEAAGHVDATTPKAADPDGHNYGWGLLLRTLADILQHERRPRVANAALEVLFSLVTDYGARWDERAWRILLQRVLPHMFTVPALSDSGGRGGSAGGAGSAESEEEERVLAAFLERVGRYFPQLCDQTTSMAEEFKLDLIRQLTTISLGLYRNPSDRLAIAGLHAFLRLATTLQTNHSDTALQGMLSQLSTAVEEDLTGALALAQRMRERAQAAPPPTTGTAPSTPPAVQSSPFGNRLLEQHMGSSSPGGSPKSPLRQQPASPFTSGGSSNMGGSASSSGASSYQQGQTLAGSKPALARSQGGPWAGEQQLYRTRTRLLVLMQRALAQLHKQALTALPWQVQGQLLDILACTVDAAMRFNTGAAAPKQQAAAGAELAAALLARKASAISAGSSFSMTGLVESASASSQEQQQVAMGAGGPDQRADAAGTANGGEAAGLAASSSNGDVSTSSAANGISANGAEHLDQRQQQQAALSGVNAGTSTPTQAPSSPSKSASRLRALNALPQLLVSSAESVEVVRPALMRLEAEGGMLLVQGLLLSLDAAANASSRPAIEQKLRRLCRDIISCAADSSTAASTSGAKASSGGVGTPAAGTPDNPLRDALYGTTWEHAVRAPLVVKALEALGRLQGDDFRSEVLLVFPSLARLACSSQIMVRQALYRVLAAQEFGALLAHAAQTGLET